jgi:hypothetical protein
MANRETQIVVETVLKGSPAVRTSQLVVETILGNTPNIRASQVVLEVVSHNPNAPIQPIMEFIL